MSCQVHRGVRGDDEAEHDPSGNGDEVTQTGIGAFLIETDGLHGEAPALWQCRAVAT